MKLLYLNLILLLVICLSSCYTQKFVTVKVDYNPKLSLKPDTNTILLINQFDLSKTKISDPKKLDVIKAGAFIAIRYAETHLKQLHHVNVINIVDSAAFKVNTDSVKVLAANYHADYVLALDNFNADMDLSALKSTGESYSIKTTVNFMLYESNGIYFKKLNGEYDDLHEETDSYAQLADLIFQPTIKGKKRAVKSAAQFAADDALQDYLKHTIIHNRPLDMDEWLQPAVMQIQAHNYTKADSLLQRFLNDKNPIVASKAAYTLAVVYEAGGYIDMAEEEAQASLDKWKYNHFAAALLNDLKQE